MGEKSLGQKTQWKCFRTIFDSKQINGMAECSYSAPHHPERMGKKNDGNFTLLLGKYCKPSLHLLT